MSGKLFALLALAGIGLAGCANQPKSLYYWGDFQDQQYAYFKGEKGPEAAILDLEKVRENARAKGQDVPPGLQAHLAMLYGQTGRDDLFRQNLEAERQQFPESSAYLDFLLKNKLRTESASHGK